MNITAVTVRLKPGDDFVKCLKTCDGNIWQERVKFAPSLSASTTWQDSAERDKGILTVSHHYIETTLKMPSELFVPKQRTSSSPLPVDQTLQRRTSLKKKVLNKVLGSRPSQVNVNDLYTSDKSR